MVQSQTLQPMSLSLRVRVLSAQPDVRQTLHSMGVVGLLWEPEQDIPGGAGVPLKLCPAFRPQYAFRIGHGVLRPSPLLNGKE